VIENLWTQSNHDLEAWRSAPLPNLILHIVEHYHLEARLGMAHMENLAAEAVLREGTHHAGLLELRDELGRFCRDLRVHMAMEEQTLFPYLLGPEPSGPAELMPPLVKLLEDGHQAETELFRRLHSLSAEYLPAAGARNLRERFEHALKAMEKSLQAHVLLETQVLFRRVF
jgi:regulator of cell morphogenesis and NO signaling